MIVLNAPLSTQIHYLSFLCITSGKGEVELAALKPPWVSPCHWRNPTLYSQVGFLEKVLLFRHLRTARQQVAKLIQYRSSKEQFVLKELVLLPLILHATLLGQLVLVDKISPWLTLLYSAKTAEHWGRGLLYHFEARDLELKL